MGVIDIKRDGPVTLSMLDSILTKMDAELSKVFEEFADMVSKRFADMETENRKLRAELETERRLRLGKRP